MQNRKSEGKEPNALSFPRQWRLVPYNLHGQSTGILYIADLRFNWLFTKIIAVRTVSKK